MLGLILFIVAAFVLGWALDHPAAFAIVLVPIVFALVAGDNVDIPVAILGIALTALAVVAGRALARRRPLEDVVHADEDNERDEGAEHDEDSGDGRDEGHDSEDDERGR